MIAAIFAVYVVICIALIVVVLLQAGKGAGLGAAFGGSSSTVFGSAGRASFLTKITAGLAAVFMIISLFLAWNSSRTYKSGLMDNYKEPPAQPEMPTGALPPAGGTRPMTLSDWPDEETAEEPATLEETPLQSVSEPAVIIEDELPAPIQEPETSE